MGWGMYVNNVYVSRVMKDDIGCKLEDAQHMVTYLEKRLLVLAASTPHAMPDDEDWSDYVQREVRDILEELRDQYWLMSILSIAKTQQEDIEDSP